MSLDPTKLVGARNLGGKVTAMCPVCQESSRSHLVIFPDGRFGCVVDSSPEHRKAIWQLIGTDSDGIADTVEPEPRIELPRVYSASLLDNLVKDYSYWEKRGIAAETVEPFRGGIATQFQMADRWVFPQFNLAGEIIGFSGRCLRKMTSAERKQWKRPKWKHLSASSTFIWGGLDDIADRVVLVESIGDSLALRQHGVPETLCLFGTTLSQPVLGWLIAHNPRQIIVSTNLDDEKMIGNRLGRPGQEAAERIKRALLRFFDESVVSILHPQEGLKDWGEADAAQIQAAFGENLLDTASKE